MRNLFLLPFIVMFLTFDTLGQKVPDWISEKAENAYESVTGAIDAAAENAFAAEGAIIYPAAAITIEANNLLLGKNFTHLDSKRKGLLRKDFGNLVDNVEIMYEAWLYQFEKITVDPSAQTFGNKIYIEDRYRPGDEQQLMLLAHEMFHSQQCKELGGLTQFGREYFRQYFRAGLSYTNNFMEYEARRFTKCFGYRYQSDVQNELVFDNHWGRSITSIVPYKVEDELYILTYSAESGSMRIKRSNSNATSFKNIYSNICERGWTSIFSYKHDESLYCFLYNNDNGIGKIFKLTTSTPEFICQFNIGKGWTSFMPFILDGKTYYLSYKEESGDVSSAKLSDQAPITLWADRWSEGWTNFHFFIYNNSPHFLSYKRWTGTVHFTSIDQDAKGTNKIRDEQWSTGWTNFVSLSSTGLDYLAYKGPFQAPYASIILPGNGTAHISRIESPRKSTEERWCNIWRGTWSIITSFENKGQTHFLLYGAGNSQDEVKIYKVNL